MGGRSQAPLQRTRPRPQVSGPVHTPRGYLQWTLNRNVRRPGDIPLEGLGRPQYAETHDLACSRVYPPVSAPCPARRLCQNPPLRIPRQLSPHESLEALWCSLAYTAITRHPDPQAGKFHRTKMSLLWHWNSLPTWTCSGWHSDQLNLDGSPCRRLLMKTLDYNSDPRPLGYRSLEWRPNFVRASQKPPFHLVHQTFKSLARRVSHRFFPSRRLRGRECAATKTNQSP
jgi:hypothetical protein